MKKKIVIKFSGKVFAMENVKLLKDYARFLVKISKTYQPIVVAGGGKIARHYITHSMPLAPSKQESNSIILIKKEGSKVIPKILPISEISLVSSMSGKMNILRVYTQQKNRNKVEMAAKSILGEL